MLYRAICCSVVSRASALPGRTGRVNLVKNDLYEAWAWRSTVLTADQRGRWRCAACGNGQARRTSQREVFALKLIDQHSAERRPAELGRSGQAAACAARAVSDAGPRMPISSGMPLQAGPMTMIR